MDGGTMQMMMSIGENLGTIKNEIVSSRNILTELEKRVDAIEQTLAKIEGYKDAVKEANSGKVSVNTQIESDSINKIDASSTTNQEIKTDGKKD